VTLTTTWIPESRIEMAFNVLRSTDADWTLTQHKTAGYMLVHDQDVTGLIELLADWEAAQLTDENNDGQFLCNTGGWYIVWDGESCVHVEGQGDSATYNLSDFGYQGNVNADNLRAFFVQLIVSDAIFNV
jgi:hypothetical protein